MPTLAQFAPRYVEGHAKANRQKPSTIRAKEAIIERHPVPRFGDRKLDQLGNEQVQRLKGELAELSNKTVNNVLSTLNTLLKVAVEWEVIDSMPCTIKLLKVAEPAVRFYDFDRYEDLIEAARPVGPEALLVVLLGGDAGLRLGEMIALEQSDVDYKRGQLVVQQSEWLGEVGLPKGGRIRRLPLTRRLAQALKAHRPLRGPRVLYRAGGHTVNRHVLRQAERRAGLEPVGALHVLRHTFCSHLAMKGAPARAIQELAGHKDLKTTQRYMHLSPAAIEGAIRLLDERGSGHALGDILETTSDGRAR